MKKQLLFLIAFCSLATPLAAEPSFGEQDFYYQKQIFTHADDSPIGRSCQAVYITPEWLLTAAHCVTPFIKKEGCQVELTLAQGASAQASVTLPCSHVYLPQPKQGTRHLPWDLALLYYEDGSLPYQFVSDEKEFSSQEEFVAYASQKDASLQAKWDNRVPEKILPLYTFHKNKPHALLAPIVVAEPGNTTYVGTERHPLLFGKAAPGAWVTDGFGVEKGNSGGGVMVYSPEDGSLQGLLGIVSAAVPNSVPKKLLRIVRQLVPDFGSNHQFFIFYGFDEKSSLAFIQNTLGANSALKTERLRDVLPENFPQEETYQLKVK